MTDTIIRLFDLDLVQPYTVTGDKDISFLAQQTTLDVLYFLFLPFTAGVLVCMGL